jgi:release factor glutamine methyltransferase
MQLAFALDFAKQQLCAVTDVPQLEAEVLLAFVLNKSRSYLHAWPEKILEISQQNHFLELLNKRTQGEPIAYLTGQREFWSLNLRVTPDVLIPRPETELLVELVLNLFDQATVADLGTGSGAIALSLAHERPSWIIHATDASLSALDVAKSNADRLNIKNVIFHQGNWCDPLPPIEFNVIVSNPPYIAEDDVHLTTGDLRFEPRSALVSLEQGLKDITEIIYQSKQYLISGGVLMLEHGSEQAANVARIFAIAGYTDINTHQDLAGLDRVTIASWVRF